MSYPKRYMVRLPTYLQDEMRRLSAANRRTVTAEVIHAVDMVLSSYMDGRFPTLPAVSPPPGKRSQRSMIPWPPRLHEEIARISQALKWTKARLIVVAVYLYVSQETSRDAAMSERNPDEYALTNYADKHGE